MLATQDFYSMFDHFSKLCFLGLIQKEKVETDCEKGAQLALQPTRLQLNDDPPSIMIMKFTQTIHYMYFPLSCYYIHIMLLI